MQRDLFHIYTVDAHTMMVIRNMRRFRYEAALEEFPIAHRCVKNIPKGELLYLAGLFHDIGKGRGGDHSELGAADARVFCAQHNLNEADTALVCWLVERHLYMSSVAQNRDIYDPEVVAEFAGQVKSQMRLDYLYALTVADINATNPTLWNGWRASLMRHLYAETKRFRWPRTSRSTVKKQFGLIRKVPWNSWRQKTPTGTAPSCKAFGMVPGEDFFLRHTTSEIVALGKAMLDHDDSKGAFVSLSPQRSSIADEGATEIYVLDQDRPRTPCRHRGDPEPAWADHRRRLRQQSFQHLL